MIAFLDLSGVMCTALIWRIHATTIWFLVLPDTGYDPASGFSLNLLTHVLTMCVSVSPTALVAVVHLYILFLLSSVPYRYLLGFGNTLIANPYLHTLTDRKQTLETIEKIDLTIEDTRTGTITNWGSLTKNDHCYQLPLSQRNL